MRDRGCTGRGDDGIEAGRPASAREAVRLYWLGALRRLRGLRSYRGRPIRATTRCEFCGYWARRGWQGPRATVTDARGVTRPAWRRVPDAYRGMPGELEHDPERWIYARDPETGERAPVCRAVRRWYLARRLPRYEGVALGGPRWSREPARCTDLGAPSKNRPVPLVSASKRLTLIT